NAKIDHATLRASIRRSNAAEVARANSQDTSDLEHRLAPHWRDVLGLETVPHYVGFLALGGDSLTAARLAGRLREAVPEARSVFFDELLQDILKDATI